MATTTTTTTEIVITQTNGVTVLGQDFAVPLALTKEATRLFAFRWYECCHQSTNLINKQATCVSVYQKQ
jgi:hypothetical protein